MDSSTKISELADDTIVSMLNSVYKYYSRLDRLYTECKDKNKRMIYRTELDDYREEVCEVCLKLNKEFEKKVEKLVKL